MCSAIFVIYLSSALPRDLPMQKKITKNIEKQELLSPNNFYKFHHRTQEYSNPLDPQSGWLAPLWLIGNSPFDRVISPNTGHVAHLANPRFLARWKKCDAPDKSNTQNQLFYFDDELEILLFEISWQDKMPASEKDINLWLLEAVSAIAYSLGEICELEPQTRN